ncbi:MAG: sigma-54 dependent transcriptional regulator [Syntrophobacterales bacterium]|nr:sigma-54 dependent transcriptional regulator [Syntrophobacterales bacterium]
MAVKGKLLIIDDDGLILSALTRSLKKQGYEILADQRGQDALALAKSFQPDVVLLDIKLPGKNGIEILQEFTENRITAQVIMLTSDDTAETAIKAMKLGAVDYLTKPFDLEEVEIVVHKAIEKDRLEREVQCLRLASSDFSDNHFIGNAIAIQEIKAEAAKMAAAKVSTLLITGESGTGKEVLARHIHRLRHGEEGARCAPFLPINCSALPESLLESELFGYEKGAFTDAKAEKKGVFELANKGSILLDEIGDMKQDLQSKLLRIVERKAVRRIGGGMEIPVDVTVMATTNRDLTRAIAAQEFRMDLYYRLNAFSIHLPPLRERKEDIPALAGHFLSWFCRRYNNTSLKGFSREAEELMKDYRWPGNVRELRNVIERFVVLEKSELIRPEQLPQDMIRPAAAAEDRTKAAFRLPEGGISLDDVEKDFIIQALERGNRNKVVAAKLLNITYQSLRYQIQKFGLE